MKHNRSMLIGSLAVVLAVSFLLGLVPDTGPSLGLTAFVVGTELCAVFLVLSVLHKFKTAFKKVYYLITAGICLSALASIVASALGLSNVAESNGWNIVSNILSTASVALMYWGLVRLHGLVAGRGAAWVQAFVFGLTIIVGVALMAIDHPDNQLPELLFDSQNLLDLLVVPCGLLGLYIAQATASQVSARYVPMVRSLGWAFLGITIGILTEIVSSFAAVPLAAQSILALGGSLVFIIAVLRAAYNVRRATADDLERADAASIIDVNVYLASLASTPANVDKILDPMRRITATQQPGSMTPQTKAVLQQVHTELLAYLVAHDPIRSFTEQELRETIQLKFGDDFYATRT